jgi:hypothetical protein
VITRGSSAPSDPTPPTKVRRLKRGSPPLRHPTIALRRSNIGQVAQIMFRLIFVAAATSLMFGLFACRNVRTDTEERLTAEIINSGFAAAHDSYNAISCASNGIIYYILSSGQAAIAAQMYSYDPASRSVRHLGDLNQAAGEQSTNGIAQGKSHVSFIEFQGKLFFATHLGYYSIVDGMEQPGVPPAGMHPYPGGHFLCYDIAGGRFENLAVAPRHEGIITFNMDTRRGRLYGLTWPSGRLLRFDLARSELKDIGAVSEEGESGKGDRFRTICRSISIDPNDGSVYFSTADGRIHRYDYATEKVETPPGDTLKKDYFGVYDPATAGSMAYNWRQTFWYAPEKAIYGVHGNSGYLFRYRPQSGAVEVLDRITSLPSKRSGMYDQFSYGYLGFALGPDNRTIYYLTGGPIYQEGHRVEGKVTTAKGESKGRENLHLITWDIPAQLYTDHGPIFFPDGGRPSYVNSIAIGKDGSVYALSRVSEDPQARTDLIRIPPVTLRRPNPWD